MLEEKYIDDKNATALWKVQRVWRNWLIEEFEPVSLITLTFDTDKKVPNLTDGQAWSLFKKWVHEINLHVIGKKYKRKFKHSYFSYVVTREIQTRGVIHFHVIVDNYIPYKFAQSIWWNMAGYIDLTPIKDAEGSIRYILKYLTKTDIEPVVWKVKNKVSIETIDINKNVQRYLDEIIPNEIHG